MPHEAKGQKRQSHDAPENRQAQQATPAGPAVNSNNSQQTAAGDWLATEMVVRAWADECGGPQAVSLHHDLETVAGGGTLAFNRESFEATANLFTKAGLSANEHLTYRTKNLLPRCSRILWKTISECNPNWFLDDEERSWQPRERFTQPNINRAQLEIEATKEYILEITQTSCKSHNGVPEDKHLLCHEAGPGRSTAEPAASGASQPQSNAARGPRLNCLRPITNSDITQQGLTEKEVMKYFLANKPQQKKGKLVTIGEADWAQNLQKEAYRSTKHLEPGELDPPIRVQQTLGSPWHWVAVTRKGKSGRGGLQHGNRYGIINENANTLEEQMA